jgi:hypothetical protein
MGDLMGEYKRELRAIRDAIDQGGGEYHLSTHASEGVWGLGFEDGETFGGLVALGVEVSGNREEEAYGLLTGAR